MAIGQACYKVFNSSTNSSTYTNPNDWGATDDLFGKLSGVTKFTKVGIQAPPGLVVIINDREFIIGRNGIYELDDKDIVITKLCFKQPSNSEDLRNIIVDYVTG